MLVRRLLPAATAAALAGLLAVVCAPAASAAGPTRATAARYAARTYVVDAGRHRPFALIGAGQTVRAADGSTITGFGMVLADSGDGTGQAVLLFRGTRFLGWASAFDALHLSVGASGRAIVVTYGVYSGDDPFCCPSSRRAVRYRWTGRRIAASANPPLIYGRRGSRLHLVG
jgi:hypothetical protein